MTERSESCPRPAPYLVTLSGEIDVRRSAELRAICHAFADSHEAHVLVDLAEVTFMDSTALHLLVDLHRTAKVRGGTLTVKSPKPIVQRVLKVVAFDKIMTIVN